MLTLFLFPLLNFSPFKALISHYRCCVSANYSFLTDILGSIVYLIAVVVLLGLVLITMFLTIYTLSLLFVSLTLTHYAFPFEYI